MGIESVLYVHEPGSCEVECLRGRLVELGASEGSVAGGYVISGDDHWFDLLVRSTGRVVERVQVRVAVTNPVASLTRLQALLSMLLRECNGSVLDLAGDRVFSDPGFPLEDLAAGFLAQRTEFIEHFGEHDLPISADDVFPSVRQRPTS